METKEDTPKAHVRVLTVQNQLGIHARPAAMIVRISNKYTDVEVWVEKEGEQVNGKSIMGLMMLAAAKSSQLRFMATGLKSETMLSEIEDLFRRKFEEA